MRPFVFMMMLMASAAFSVAQPTINSIVDRFTGGTKLAPGGLALLTGTNLGVTATVSVAGTNAAVIFQPQNSNSMTIEIPVTAALGSNAVTLTAFSSSGVATSAAFSITLVQYAPVLINVPTGAQTSPRHSNGVGVTSTTPAAAGENITVFAIGLGPTNPSVNTGAVAQNTTTTTTAQATISFNSGSAVNVTARLNNGLAFFSANSSAGLVGSIPANVGVYQFTFQVPSGTAAGTYPLTLSIGGATSNSTQIVVGPAPTGPVISAMVNEQGRPAFAPGDVVFVSGLNLGTSPAVSIGGKAAFNVSYVANTNSITIEIPVDAPIGSTSVTVTNGNQTSAAYPITISQVAPALAQGGNGQPQTAFHLNGKSVTNANPAVPGETIGISAYGLGATKPVVPTGTVTPQSGDPIATVASVTVNVGTLAPIAAQVAGLSSGQIGLYFVLFTVPTSGLISGAVPTSITIGGQTTSLVGINIFLGPVITNVTNAGSNNNAALPNSAIAQGSIFTVSGSALGPATLAIADRAFQNTTLSGTSMTVTVAGTTVNPTLYYTSANKVAALLPSNTPTGTGTVTVTNNGTVGIAAAITVVPSNLGIFTVSSDGAGTAIVTYPDYSLVSPVAASNCGGPYTVCGAANPGDTLVLWATGLGPITGNDSAGDGLGVAMPNIPLSLFLGGVKANVGYQGRGCCIGEDQIVFTVPDNVPTGCSVSLVVQIGNLVSNGTLIAIAPKGTRTCSISDPIFAGPDLATAVTNLTAPATLNQLTLSHDPNVDNSGKVIGNVDTAFVDSINFTILPGIQPFAATYLDQAPFGTCNVINQNQKLDLGNYFASANEIDGGPSFTVTGPNGSQSIVANRNQVTLSATGAYLTPGAYTYSGTGGADYGSFSTPFTLSDPVTLTTPSNGASITVIRSNGLTLNWTGGSTSSFIRILGNNATDFTGNVGATFECIVSPSATSFTVPPSVLLALPAGNFGAITVQTNFETRFTLDKLNLGITRERASSVIFATYQ